MTIGQRFLLTIIIVLVILFAMAAFGYFTGGWEGDYAHSAAARYVVPERFQADVAALERQAADQAYVEHIVGLYNTWVSQVANLGHDSERIDKGLDNNRKAYIIARERMERAFPH